MHLGSTEKPAKVSEHIGHSHNKRCKLRSSTTLLSFDAPARGTPANIRIYLISIETINDDLQSLNLGSTTPHGLEEGKRQGRLELWHQVVIRQRFTMEFAKKN